MFGYVLPFKPELKIKEYQIFKAYYCSVCKSIGDKSIISRFALTYDMTFLSLLLSSIYEDEEILRKRFCFYKMKNVVFAEPNLFIKYAADMNIILWNRKLVDNYLDTKNIIYILLSDMLKSKQYTDIVYEKIQKIDKHLNELRKLERLKCNSIDEVGHCFANITAEIFSIYDDKYNKILRQFGYNIGKWIYTIDAFDDIEKDIKNNNYNPCIYKFNYKGNSPREFKMSIRENIEFTLFKCLNEISKAFELLELKRNRGIIENIVYIGLERKTMKIIEGGCNCEKSL